MNKVRVGVVGAGNSGTFHAQYLNSVENACLAAICDIDPVRREVCQKKFGVPVYEDHLDMLADGKIDAVLIATPHYSHVPIATTALEHGIHTLVEKPLAVGVKEARWACQVAAKYPNLKFAIMFNCRTYPLYAKVRELISAGELGPISRITWVSTDWFRTWAYYASGGWRATWAGEGGGLLLNQCPHDLDQLYWLTGMMPRRVTAVASIGKTHPIEVEDEVSAILEYPGGAVGHFIATTGEAPGTNRLEIAGDRGKLIVEGGTITFFRTRQSVQEFNRTTDNPFGKPETWQVEVPLRKKTEEHSHRLITQNFVNAILNNEPLIAPATDGVKSLEIGNAILLSGMTGKRIELPIDGDVYDAFIKDLTRQYGGKKMMAETHRPAVDLSSSFKA